MKKSAFSALTLLAVLLLTLSGCLDIGGSFKPGSFGKTPREEAMVEAIVEKYGDLSEKGDPRFLEARMTSGIQEFIPVDTVQKYSKDAEKLYVWFVYDNFNNDEIEVEWTYTDENYSIHTFKEKTGEDLGRGAFILEKPDDGWALGNYKVEIRGRNLKETLTFEIIDGATVSVPISFENGNIGLSNPAWHLIESKFIVSTVDQDVLNGPSVGYMMGGAKLLDYYQDTGSKGDVIFSHKRTDEGGGVLCFVEWGVKWSDPPGVILADQTTSFTIEHITLKKGGGWDSGNVSANFDVAGMVSGATFGRNRFLKPGEGNEDARAMVRNEKTVMTTERPIAAGEDGKQMAIYIELGEGYIMRYTYEWRS